MKLFSRWHMVITKVAVLPAARMHACICTQVGMEIRRICVHTFILFLCTCTPFHLPCWVIRIFPSRKILFADYKRKGCAWGATHSRSVFLGMFLGMLLSPRLWQSTVVPLQVHRAGQAVARWANRAPHRNSAHFHALQPLMGMTDPQLRKLRWLPFLKRLFPFTKPLLLLQTSFCWKQCIHNV